ncbi:unnamed protein product [Rhodiola kirilowii]
MYNRRDEGKSSNNETFMWGVRTFIEVAIARGELPNEMRCPCKHCKNKKCHVAGTVENHLYKSGFTPNYYNWTHHSEDRVDETYNDEVIEENEQSPITEDQYQTPLPYEGGSVNYEPFGFMQNTMDSRYNEMVNDVAAQNWEIPIQTETLDDHPNETAQSFYDLISASTNPAYEGCTTETELSSHMKLLQTKADYGLSVSAYDSICDYVQSLANCENRMPTSFNHSKKIVSDLGMGYQRIDLCVNGCMIYYAESESMITCNFCEEDRYQPGASESTSHYTRVARSSMFYLDIIPRLERLFLMKNIAKHMSWHASHSTDPNSMVHPSDGEAWKHFDSCYPDFSAETRNVRLGLCSDGFNPFRNNSKSYSCWPVMVTPYNVPPWMCMKTRFMWLTILIPGPTNPKKRIDMYLRPLIDDLKTLYNVGVNTYDASRKENFTLRAALIWTISDFPAYGMLSGWSTQGKLGCPYCMKDTKTFWLQHGRKVSYFDCHRRFLPIHHGYRYNTCRFRRDRVEHDGPIPFRSGHEIYNRVQNSNYVWEESPDHVIEGFGVTHNWTKKSFFWDLPYWVNLKLRHNLDVMHIEKNVFENIFNTVMNVKGKTKDNGAGCREDIATYCKRPELELRMSRGRMIGNKAKYTLTSNEKTEVLEWIKCLAFPDGFASNLGRCVNLQERKLIGYKSHDAHVFLERLMPIAFRGFLSTPIWTAISELCTFFRDVCASSLDITRMTQWKTNIPETLCNLETIFPPSFFDSMEHLPIHVADEVLLGGHVHYRWMYPFERFIYRLKNMVWNKSQVAFSIVMAYLQLEITFLGSDYLGPEYQTKERRPKRNEIIGDQFVDEHISIYNHPGRGGKPTFRRSLSDCEFYKATHYILSNTHEMDTYLRQFDAELRQRYPQDTKNQLYDRLLEGLPTWLKKHIWELRAHNELLEWIYHLSLGFNYRVTCTSTYKVNNYKFCTESYNHGRKKTYCQVQLKVEGGGYFYGVIEEIIHMCCSRNPRLKVVLFKCRWIDPRYVQCFPNTGLIEANLLRIYQPYDPFILAQQAEQVYFVEFPGQANRTMQGWIAVCRVKPTNQIKLRVADVPYQDEGECSSINPTVDGVVELENLASDVVNVYNMDDETEEHSDSPQERETSNDESESDSD